MCVNPKKYPAGSPPPQDIVDRSVWHIQDTFICFYLPTEKKCIHWHYSTLCLRTGEVRLVPVRMWRVLSLHWYIRTLLSLRDERRKFPGQLPGFLTRTETKLPSFFCKLKITSMSLFPWFLDALFDFSTYFYHPFEMLDRVISPCLIYNFHKCFSSTNQATGKHLLKVWSGSFCRHHIHIRMRRGREGLVPTQEKAKAPTSLGLLLSLCCPAPVVQKPLINGAGCSLNPKCMHNYLEGNVLKTR